MLLLIYKSTDQGRINACIPSDDMGDEFTDNLVYINDSTKEQFGNLGLYCTKKAIITDSTIITLSVDKPDTWYYQKVLSITIRNQELGLSGYKIVNNKNECNSDAGWTSISGKSFVYNKTYTDNHDAIGKNYFVCAKNTEGSVKYKSITINKIDNIKPTCGTITGAKTNWTNTNFGISVACNDTGGSGCANGTFTKQYNATKKTDYITIKDNAGNTTNCPVNVYLDKNAPTCNSSAGNVSSWTNSSRTISYGCIDGNSESGCYTTTQTRVVTTEGEKYRLRYTIKDNAGNTTNCDENITVRIDKTGPSCGTASGSSTTWTNSDRTINLGCSDSLSQCTKSTYPKTYSTTTTNGSTTIYDKAGNSTVCNYNVYVDKTAPTCGTAQGASTTWTYSNRTVYQYCNDSHSGCYSSYFPATYSTNTVRSSTTIRDNAGNTSTCSYDVYVDKTRPTISVATTPGTNKITIKVTVNNVGPSGIKTYTYKSGTSSYTSTLNSYTFSYSNCNSKTIKVYVTNNAGKKSTTITKTVKPTCNAPTITPVLNGNLTGTLANDFINTKESATAKITTNSTGTLSARIISFRKSSNGATGGSSNYPVTISSINQYTKEVTVKGYAEGWARIEVTVAATTNYTSASSTFDVYVYQAATTQRGSTPGTGWFKDGGWWWQPAGSTYYVSGWAFLPETQNVTGTSSGRRTSISDCNSGSSYLNAGFRCKWFYFNSGGWLVDKEYGSGCYGVAIDNLKEKLRTGNYKTKPRPCSQCLADDATVNNRYCYD